MRRRVAVVFGGRSAEHEVSVISARSVIEALDPERYEVIAIGVTRDGRWQLLPAGPPALVLVWKDRVSLPPLVEGR